MGYRFIDDPCFTPAQHASFEHDPAMRDMFNVRTDEEIRDRFKDMLSNLGDPPLRVVFRDQICLDCGVRGDERLMPKFCHMKASQVHDRSHPDRVHPVVPAVPYHPDDIPIKIHPGYLNYPPWHKSLFRRKQSFTCCGGHSTSPGCTFKWTCCGRTKRVGESSSSADDGCQTKFECCGKPEDSEGCELLYGCCGRNRNQEGCRKVCQKCGADWGSDAGRCFIKKHNVTSASERDEEEANKFTTNNIKVENPLDKILQLAAGKGTPDDAVSTASKKRTSAFLAKCQLPTVVPYPVV